MTIEEMKKISNEQLIAGTAKLIGLQNQCIAKQVVFIMEIDRRRLHWKAGYSDLATFLVEKFAITRDQADKRIRVARVLDYFPQLLEPLRRGQTTLTNLALAAPRLTQANCQVVLENIQGCSKRQALEFLSRVTANGLVQDTADPYVDLKIRVPRDLLDKLERAREVLASKGQNPKNHEILDVALESLLDRRDPMRKARRAAERKERAGRPKPAATAEQGSAHQPDKPNGKGGGRRPVPAAMRNEVWLRDGGQCTFRADDGHRCTERGMLEIDHVVPVCRGGTNTLNNLRLRCRSHNQYTAEIALGSVFMAARRGDRRPVHSIKREPIERALLVPEPVDLAGAGFG